MMDVYYIFLVYVTVRQFENLIFVVEKYDLFFMVEVYHIQAF